MIAPMILPATSAASSEIDEDYGFEPVISLLTACLPFLSAQDLNLISSDIRSYVLSPDKNIQNTNLFRRYSGARLVLSEFRNVFRAKVAGYRKKGLIVKGQTLDPQKQNIYVHEIIQRLSYLLYQRLTCYTAGLDTDLITALSTTAYESKSLKGETIAILPSLKWLGTNPVAMFASPQMVTLEQHNVRAIRKQLNTCGDGALAVCKDEVSGVYKTVGLLSKKDSLKFPRFQFPRHAEWIFAVAGSKRRGDGRVRYCNGSLMLPVVDMKRVYREKMEKLSIKPVARTKLGAIIDAADKCTHGTILIIAETNIIQAEVERLTANKRGTQLNPPVPLVQGRKSSPVLEQFAAVDGAIFLDFEGNCYAFGVILDGIVSNKGSNARGSRYNSTKTYTEWARDIKYHGATILGVVKSEDGMIDFFNETKA